jgi:hypothetical protein
MQTWFQDQLARGFPAFAGAIVRGTIPIRQELLNDILAEFLRTDRDVAPPRTVDPGRAAETLKKLVKSAVVRAEQGVVVIEFELRV